MANLRSKVCILSSGGIDSSLLIQEALERKHEIYPLFVAFGFLWEKTELKYLQKLLKTFFYDKIHPLNIHTLPYQKWFPDHWGFDPHRIPDLKAPDSEVFIQGRNLLLLTNGVCFAAGLKIDKLWLGSLKGNPFKDAQVPFIKETESLYRKVLPNCPQIEVPFLEKTKSQLLKSHPNFPYHLTLTCLNPQGEKHCGQCNKCRERREHFDAAGITDPVAGRL